MQRATHGQSAVEALLGTILFVTLIFGGLELARAVSLKQALDRGAFEGARYLATHGDVAGTTPVVRAAVGRVAGQLTKGNLSELLQAREQLNNLMTYMDGKTGAEDLIAKVLNDPSLLQAVASAPKPQETATPAAEE